jgi:hypothetical protein
MDAFNWDVKQKNMIGIRKISAWAKHQSQQGQGGEAMTCQGKSPLPAQPGLLRFFTN